MPDLPDQILTLPVAHTGHWIVWVLYAVPVVAVCAALWISSRRADPVSEGGDTGDAGADPADPGDPPEPDRDAG